MWLHFWPLGQLWEFWCPVPLPHLGVRFSRREAEVLHVYPRAVSKHIQGWESQTRNYSLAGYFPTEFVTLLVNCLSRQVCLSYDWKLSEGCPTPFLKWMWLFPNQQPIESCLFIYHNNIIFRGQAGIFSFINLFTNFQLPPSALYNMNNWEFKQILE